MEKLREISNKALILALIGERKSDMDPFSPLATRLGKLARWIRRNVSDDGLQKVDTPPLPPPSDKGAEQVELVEGAKELKKLGPFRKPKDIRSSKHKPPVSLSTELEVAIIKDYHNEVLIDEIVRKCNTSPGEVYRVLHRHHIPLNRAHRQSKMEV
jgi:hypothetical protein